MQPLTNDQIQELAIADKRVASDSAGVATDTNAGDVANLDYAGKQIGASNIANIQSIAGIGTGEPISDGTDVQRDTYNTNKQDVADSITGAESNVESSTSVIDRLQAERDSIMKTTYDDLAAIEDAGKVAGAQYEGAIKQAEEARKTTLASDVVRAGSRGGFENTQMAGIAALKGTDSTTGEAFVGAGGALDQSRQKLDMNISMIKDQQRQAIAAAKAAERKYIQTGKRQDYQDSIDLVKLANDMENDKTTLQMQKENLKINQAQEQRAQVASELNNLNSFIDIQGKIAEGQEFQIGGETYTGTMVPDVEKAFFSGSNIISLMGQLQQGETTTLPPDPVTGQVWTITGTKDPDTTAAYDDRGNLSVIDKATGQVISRAEGVGKTKTQASSVTLNMKEDTKAIKASISNALNLARDPETDTIKKQDYINQYLTFVSSDLGDVGAFRAQFPPNLYFSEEEAKTVNKELAEAEAGSATLNKDDEEYTFFE